MSAEVERKSQEEEKWKEICVFVYVYVCKQSIKICSLMSSCKLREQVFSLEGLKNDCIVVV